MFAIVKDGIRIGFFRFINDAQFASKIYARNCKIVEYKERYTPKYVQQIKRGYGTSFDRRKQMDKAYEKKRSGDAWIQKHSQIGVSDRTGNRYRYKKWR